jgi:hypothetical protein
MPSLSAATAIDIIFKSLGGNRLKIVIVDEVSMLSTNFIVLLDTRLRSMYDPDKLFGGISILFIGDFVQLPVTTGRDLWSVMHGIVSGNDANARNLFQKFQVHELTANMQSAECKTHPAASSSISGTSTIISIRTKMERGRQCTIHTHHPRYC